MIGKRGTRWALVLALFRALAPGTGAQAPAHPQPGGAPRIGLVLSGGGARGAAHVGVLQVLEEQRVPIHAVVGTSMGAVVGAMCAAGWTPEEMERELASSDWDVVPAGSLTLAIRTLLGPVYLTAGYARGGSLAACLSIGRSGAAPW